MTQVEELGLCRKLVGQSPGNGLQVLIRQRYTPVVLENALREGHIFTGTAAGGDVPAEGVRIRRDHLSLAGSGQVDVVVLVVETLQRLDVGTGPEHLRQAGIRWADKECYLLLLPIFYVAHFLTCLRSLSARRWMSQTSS